MNILIRFKAIMASNIHALLDKANDPEKTINEYMRQLNSDLGKVKSETATIMAEEQRSRRALNECADEIKKMKLYAVRALESNNEVDARKFLEKKATFVAEETRLREAYETTASNARKMSEMHDKLVSDRREMEARLDTLKGNLTVTKSQERLNQIQSSTALDQLDDEVNLAIDTANAVAELNSTFDDKFNKLMDSTNNTYKDTDTNKDTNIDTELEALKDSIKKI